MLTKDELERFEKSFTKVNLATAITIIVYYIIFLLFGKIAKAPELNYVYTFIVFIIFDYLGTRYLKIYYFTFHKCIKYIILLVLGMALMLTDMEYCSYVVLASLYFSYTIQAFILFDIVEQYNRIFFAIFCTSPMLISYIIAIISRQRSNFWIYIVAIALVGQVILLYNIIDRIAELIILFYKKIDKLNSVATNNKIENDKMKQYQEKVISSNEQLSIQKFKLQEANNKITRINKEIQIRNLILETITDERNVRNQLSKLEDVIMEYMNLDLCIGTINDHSEFNEDDYIVLSKFSEESKISESNIKDFENIKNLKKYMNTEHLSGYDIVTNIKSSEFAQTEIQSIFIQPLIFNQESQGVFIIGSIKKSFFTEKKSFLQTLFSQVSLAVNNVLLYEKMENMAIKDSLTGIYNRRYFNKILEDLIKNSLELNKELSAVMIDIDKFKNINDTYGHVFGDEVISYVGHQLKNCASQNDALPVRYGGEEFVMIFRNEENNIIEIIQKLHEIIKNHHFENKGEVISINVSIGIASYPKNCKNIEELVNAADCAMYYSKKHGRGRITIYSDKLFNQ